MSINLYDKTTGILEKVDGNGNVDGVVSAIAKAQDKWYIPDSFTATIDFYGYGEPTLDATVNADKNYLDQSTGWVYNSQEKADEAGVYEWIEAVQFTKTKTEKIEKDLIVAENNIERNTATIESYSETISENAALLVDNAPKNLLKNELTAETVKDIKFTNNADGSITANGTISGSATLNKIINDTTELKPDDYFLSGCPSGGGNESYYIRSRIKYDESTYGAEFTDDGKGTKLHVSPFGQSATYGAGIDTAASIKPKAVAYGKGVFVVVSNTNPVYWSEDGINWTEGAGASGSLKDIAYSDDLGVFVAISASKIYWSSDGKTWEEGTGSISKMASVAYGDGKFIIVGNPSSVLFSEDGKTWTAEDISIDKNTTLSVVVYAESVYVAGSSTYNPYWSEDGISWTKSNDNGALILDISYGNGLFVATSGILRNDDGWFYQYSWSYDGKNWSVSQMVDDLAAGDSAPLCLGYGDGVFVAGYSQTGDIYVSFDGKNWTADKYNFTVMENGITYGNGRFIVVGQSMTSGAKSICLTKADTQLVETSIVVTPTAGTLDSVIFSPMICRNEMTDKSYEPYYRNQKQLDADLTSEVAELLTDIQSLMSKIGTDSLKTIAKTLTGAINENHDNIDNLIDTKIDKVTGKGLSTNDYTTTEKNKLAGIENGAEVNVQSDWNTVTNTDDSYIKNKPDVYSKSETYNRTEIDAKFVGLLNPMGTVAFANLPTLETANEGDMYNVSDQFATTNDFEEGSGVLCPAGSNVYKTSNGKWDVLAGSPVTGVKGNAETTYRKGNINITPQNIGIDVAGDANNPVYFSNGLPVASNFKLYSSTKATYNGNTLTNTSDRQYRVVPDASGYASVNVPWPGLTDSYDVSEPDSEIGFSQLGASTLYKEMSNWILFEPTDIRDGIERSIFGAYNPYLKLCFVSIYHVGSKTESGEVVICTSYKPLTITYLSTAAWDTNTGNQTFSYGAIRQDGKISVYGKTGFSSNNFAIRFSCMYPYIID